MKTERGTHPISPELVARKIQKVKNFESQIVAKEMQDQPRFAEMLWFLQWISNTENYAGGIERFAKDLLAESAGVIGTRAMLEIGRVKRYTREQMERLNNEDCGRMLTGEKQHNKCAVLAALSQNVKLPPIPETAMGFNEALQTCVQYAAEDLAGYIFSVCENHLIGFTAADHRRSSEELSVSAPWYFVRVCDAILAFMDRRKARVAGLIGETEITREISKWLEVARVAKRAVLIIGTERFGKTEAVKNWCLQNPGLVRLVQTPASTAESDLLREVAKALGLNLETRLRGYKLREVIDYVLTHSGLMLVLDECQFLLPGNYSKTATAPRLNWFRRSIMDKGIASALVATPQSYKPSKDRFVKRTGYAIGQFDERILKTVNLPGEVCKEDLLSIARIHFPDLAAPYLEYVVENTIATQRNFVSDIEKIGTLSKVNADQAGRKTPTLADIECAIADVLPLAPQEPATEVPSLHTPKMRKHGRTAAPLHEQCTDSARSPRSTRGKSNFSSHERETTPAELTP